MSEEKNSNAASIDQTSKLGIAFDRVINNKFSHLIAPKPLVTPFGITHLDILLGGGIVSSGPVIFSSTPETGKSTAAFQFSASFQKLYTNSITVYLDVEGSGNSSTNEIRVSRIETFGLDTERFKYEPILLDVISVFQLVEQLVAMKKEFENACKKEFYILIVWDSIAATPSSKTKDVEDPNQIIGHKARQLSFCLDKYGPLFKFHRMTFLCIDQVRANMSIEGPYAQVEKSVGSFKNMKAATNIYALQHHTQQWVYLSKKKVINAGDQMGIDGWYVDVYTEKNKLTVGQHWVTCVFDKNTGFDKFWSEYTFLSDPTPGESKIYKNKKMPFPLMIEKSGAYVCLHVTNPKDPAIKYKSDLFYRKDAKRKYENDETFHQWFDYAVQLSCVERIINGLFMIHPSQIIDSDDTNTNTNTCVENIQNFDPVTGEVFDTEFDIQNNTNIEVQPTDENPLYQSVI